MAVFRYKARNSSGNSVSGEIEAGSADAVAAQLLKNGVTPVDIRKTRDDSDAFAGLEDLLGTSKPRLEDLILFCRQMYTLAHSGVPLLRALSGLAESTRNRVLSEAISRLRSNIEGGHELSVAMGMESAVFNNLIISIVRVGETTGRLDEAFLQLSQYLEMERDTRDRVKMAMRYPTLVIIAITIAIGVINTLVIPAFVKVFVKMKLELPWQTKLLIGVSNFTVSYWPYMLIGLILLILGVRHYISQGEGKFKWDRLKLRLPIMGSLIMRSTLARFSRSFGLAFKSGVPLIQALTVTAYSVDNDYVTERILSMRNGVERGDNLTRTAAATGLFPPLVLQMFAVGEETGAIDRMMDDVAAYYEREVDYELKNLSAAIEPILIVAIGIIVLILALGVFLPMWDLTQIAHR